MRSSESCHWYDEDGNPCYTQIAKNGNERATTLADARKLNLFPSVTSIINVAAKPQLEQWKRNQMMMSFLTLPRVDGESLEQLENRIWEDAEAHSKNARDKGIEIHGRIENGFINGGNDIYYIAVRDFLDSLFVEGNEWVAEKSFVSQYGYGGKVDLHAPGIVIDFKTKDFKDDDKVEKMIYSDHGMQLAAYGKGLFCNEDGIIDDAPPFMRINIFIRPLKEGETKPAIKHYIHDEDYYKDFQMFYHLFNFWKLSKNFY